MIVQNRHNLAKREREREINSQFEQKKKRQEIKSEKQSTRSGKGHSSVRNWYFLFIY